MRSKLNYYNDHLKKIESKNTYFLALTPKLKKNGLSKIKRGEQ
jgi:hypothetical protein